MCLKGWRNPTSRGAASGACLRTGACPFRATTSIIRAAASRHLPSLSSSTRCDIAANGGCSYHLGLLRCAVVLADGAPLALAEIRSPLSPGHGALAGLE